MARGRRPKRIHGTIRREKEMEKLAGIGMPKMAHAPMQAKGRLPKPRASAAAKNRPLLGLL